MMRLLLYTLVMLMVDTVVLSSLSSRRTTIVWIRICAVGCFSAGVMAIVLGGRVFGFVGLLSSGLLIHGPVVLIVSAFLLRRERRITAACSALLGVTLGAVAIDAYLIEPTWLEVSHLRLTTPKLERRVRMVILADIQTDQFGPFEKDVFLRTMRWKPDLILLAGDYLHLRGPARSDVRHEWNAFLHEIEFSAPDGVFAVRGNIDANDWPEIFDGLPITTVEHTTTFETTAGLDLTCLGCYHSIDSRFTLPDPQTGRYHLVLGHSPSFALGTGRADLSVAGHTHGGQVRLPWIGALHLPGGLPRRLAAGLFDLPQGGQIHISRGLGMERGNAPRIRFLCRPELVVIDLEPAEQ